MLHPLSLLPFFNKKKNDTSFLITIFLLKLSWFITIPNFNAFTRLKWKLKSVFMVKKDVFLWNMNLNLKDYLIWHYCDMLKYQIYKSLSELTLYIFNMELIYFGSEASTYNNGNTNWGRYQQRGWFQSPNESVSLPPRRISLIFFVLFVFIVY